MSGPPRVIFFFIFCFFAVFFDNVKVVVVAVVGPLQLLEILGKTEQTKKEKQ